MTEDYISGYLQAISQVKDLLTPHLGGTNQFFSIPVDRKKTLRENIQQFLYDHKTYYLRYTTEEKFQVIPDNIQLEEINNWIETLPVQLATWTSDEALEKINGKNGYHLSEFLVKFLLKEFFKGSAVKAFKLLPDWGEWHWGDHMSEEFVFDTGEQVFIMHFGESS